MVGRRVWVQNRRKSNTRPHRVHIDDGPPRLRTRRLAAVNPGGEYPDGMELPQARIEQELASWTARTQPSNLQAVDARSTAAMQIAPSPDGGNIRVICRAGQSRVCRIGAGGQQAVPRWVAAVRSVNAAPSTKTDRAGHAKTKQTFQRRRRCGRTQPDRSRKPAGPSVAGPIQERRES